MDPINHPMWAEQQRIENLMATRGVDRFRADTEKAYASGNATKVGGPRFVLKHIVEPTAAVISAFIDDAGKTAGRKHTLVRYVTATPPETLAFLTAKLLLDGAQDGGEIRLTQLAVRIGLAVEIEQRLDVFEKSNRSYLKTVLESLHQRTANEGHMRKVVMGVLRNKGDNWAAWTKSEALAVGIKLIELLIDATKVAAITGMRSRGKTYYAVQMNASFSTWLNGINDQLSLLQPEHLPCVMPPKDWISPTEGAYYTDALISPPTLVKSRAKAHRKALDVADLSMVYRAVNAIQSTPWAVETRTLAVMKTIIENKLDLNVLPAMDSNPIPERPMDIPMKAPKQETQPILTPEQQARLDAWKASARDTYTANEKLASRRVQALKAVALATEFAKYPAIYFPHQLDFRGRVYAIPQVLNPQGPDFAKGLLVLGEGQPLDNDRAVGWFMIHGANTFGNDKVPFDERITWVEDRAADIFACAQDPLANTWWTEADSPFCFLTWCFEYADFWEASQAEVPSVFLSRIPIALDGTCNGLQHYSAMLRDPIGGAAVNLLPAEKPQDIYGEVAKVVMAKLVQGDYGENDRFAETWAGFGIDRAICKRPVMVLPYGGTIRSCQEYVLQAVLEKISREKMESPFPHDHFKEANAFLAGIVWESIGDVVVAARAAMGWLMDTARVASNSGKPLEWTTPSGFPVYQAYPMMERVRVDTKIHGTLAKIDLSEEREGSIDKRRQASGIAPNFVHSLDAAALILTVNLALDNGVQWFAMIHDSYGTLAASTDMLAACTRHAFVDMYEEHDVIAEFRDAVQAVLPETEEVSLTPTAGGLILSEVINSPFFFA